MPLKARRQWTISRRDLAAGGSALVRLVHPLLPGFVASRPGPGGLVLSLDGPEPQALERLEARARREYLVRLGSLAGFLSFHGLGVAAEDVARLGARPDDAKRPALGSPPVAAWRSVSPALLVACAAARLAGREVDGRDADQLRQAVDRALDGPLPRDVVEDTLTALRAADARTRPEALVSELARRGHVGRTLSRDLLGLALPNVPEMHGHGAHPVTAVGDAALWLVRGVARGEEPPFFLECAAGSALEEGAALRRLADALEGDPRAEAVRGLALGSPVAPGAIGPSFALVAISLESWDLRSRRAFEEDLGALGFRLFATRDGSVKPWEAASLVDLRIAPGDTASLLWLPFASVYDAIAAWREAESAVDGSDAARFLEVARDLAARFDPAEGRVTAPRAKALATRRGAVLEAASLLASGFGATEVSAAAAVSAEVAEEALARAVGEAVLASGPLDHFRFRNEDERRRIAARVPPAARRDAVGRLQASGASGLRFTLAALARADDSDLVQARRELESAAGAGDFAGMSELLARAPTRDPDLGQPLLAVRVLHGGCLPEAARAAASRIPEGAAREAPLCERLATSRILVRLREEKRALALCPGGTPDEDVARASVLVECRRDADARRTLACVSASLDGSPVALRLRATLLAAELHERAHEYAAATSALAQAEVLLPCVSEEGLARDLARTAGYLASDLGRTDEAIALFRRVGFLSRTALERGDATYDVAHAALDGGRFDVAARELESALALYAESGQEERYLSALGNRIDLLLQTGDFTAAREVLDRVLAHERASGRDHQVLFALPSLQELALLDGDDGAARAAFREAEARIVSAPEHPSWGDALILEAERLLGVRDPEASIALLIRAEGLSGSRSSIEPHRLRLLASASRDAGRSAPLSREALSADEAILLDAEAALSAGRPVADAACAALERLARTGAGAGLSVRRVLEWSGRFPSVFTTSAAGPLVHVARRIAQRAGLARAEERFGRLLEHVAPGVRSALSAPLTQAIVCEDSATRDAFEKVARVARSTIPVLVLGESGTGKEIVVRELHRLSGRRGPLVPVNVAALPATLAEAELFGHARGAFTGADRERKGLVEESSGGTLFLDEIGDLQLALQGKLLRVLQENEVRRLGETAVRRVDLRVVAATHRRLKEMAERGEFRADLYFRLAGVEIELAPLRERPSDLARLIDLGLVGRATLTREAAAALRSWPWPGNVRELRGALESAVALAAPGSVIGVEHLPRPLRERSTPPREGRRYHNALNEARSAAIENALRETSGNRTAAALLLGISRQSLFYEVRKLGIKAPQAGR